MVAQQPQQRRIRRQVDRVTLIVDQNEGHVCSGFASGDRPVAPRVQRGGRARSNGSHIIGDYSDQGETIASIFQPGGMMRAGYNIQPTIAGKTRMEAEKINQIANTISDLQQRAADLRRYL